jgi:hypothetical protein
MVFNKVIFDKVSDSHSHTLIFVQQSKLWRMLTKVWNEEGDRQKPFQRHAESCNKNTHTCSITKLNETNLLISFHFISSMLSLHFNIFLFFFLSYFCLLQYHGAPLMLTDILSYMNLTFTLCFTVECVLKLISYGPGVNTLSKLFLF